MMHEPEARAHSHDPIAVLALTLLRRSDGRSALVFDGSRGTIPGSHGEPAEIKVELVQDDKDEASPGDEHVLLVELRHAPPGWPTSESIAWSGTWEPRGLLRPVVEAVKRLDLADAAIERVLADDADASDALGYPADLPLLDGFSGYRHMADEVRYALYKGVGSASVAVIWPGDDSNEWLLGEGAQELRDPRPTSAAHWQVLETTWASLPASERDGEHAIESLHHALAASTRGVAPALRAAVERAELELEAMLDNIKPGEPSRLPSVTAPALRLGATIAAVETRLANIALNFEKTDDVRSDLEAQLIDVRSIRSEARQLVDMIGNVFAARHLELAEIRTTSEAAAARSDRTLQRYAAFLGAVVLVPTLIAGIFGANVALPYQGRVGGLILMIAAAAGAVCLAVAFVRWRLPPQATTDDDRGPLPRALVGLGVVLVATAIALVLIAATDGKFGTTDPADTRIRELTKVASDFATSRREHAQVAQQQMRLLTEVAALRRQVRALRGR